MKNIQKLAKEILKSANLFKLTEHDLFDWDDPLEYSNLQSSEKGYRWIGKQGDDSTHFVLNSYGQLYIEDPDTKAEISAYPHKIKNPLELRHVLNDKRKWRDDIGIQLIDEE